MFERSFRGVKGVLEMLERYQGCERVFRNVRTVLQRYKRRGTRNRGIISKQLGNIGIQNGQNGIQNGLRILGNYFQHLLQLFV